MRKTDVQQSFLSSGEENNCKVNSNCPVILVFVPVRKGGFKIEKSPPIGFLIRAFDFYNIDEGLISPVS